MHRLREFFFPERGVLRPLPYVVLVAFGIALGAGAGLTDTAQRVDWGAYDRSLRAATRDADPAPGIVVVAIDELSFAQIGLQWPWPRSLHADLTGQLKQAGARRIVFDVVFDAPGGNPEGDRALVDAVRRAGNVVLATDRANIEDRSYSVTQWSDPFPELAAAAAGIGADTIDYDPDGVLRRASLSVDGRSGLALAATDGIPGFRRPSDLARARLIRFNGPARRGIRTVSYYQALDPAGLLPPGIFRDTIVLVGRSLAAPPLDSTKDHFRTPVSLLMPGVEVHASLVDMLLRGRHVADPFATPLSQALLALLAASLAAMAFYRLRPFAAASAAVLATAAMGAVAFVGLARFDVRLPVIAPALSILAAYATSASYRFALLSGERRLIRRAFTNYVAPAIVDQMLADPSRLTLKGEEYELSVLFSDIEGFTTLSERMTPTALRDHLSGYFKEMMDLLLAERATLDKFIGDAIMVYFGCPIREPDHAARACRGALAMQRRMAELQREWSGRGLGHLRTRIGINTGRAVAGNMGTDRIFNYTIIGDCVNLASRLEGVNKEYGTLILIGPDTYRQVEGRFEAREIDLLRVKGKTQPVSIYELAGEAGQLVPSRREVFDRFASGLHAYRRAQWEVARREFGGALEIDPADGPSRTFLSRIEHYETMSLPPGWDGVHVMHAK